MMPNFFPVSSSPRLASLIHWPIFISP
jgi:hypothetical protein